MDNKAACRAVYEAFNDRKLELAADYATAETLVDMVAFGMTFKGRDGFLEFMSGFANAFPDLNITVLDQVGEGDVVVNENTWSGTHAGPLQTPKGVVPATNKKVTGARFVEIWKIRDGKIVTLTNYQDPAAWLRQLGLVE